MTVTDGLLYLDSSALVKLVVPEPESPLLLSLLVSWPQRVSSEIALVEVVRAARRASRDQAVSRRAHEVLAAVHLVRIHEEVLERASLLEPVELRSLDAIHLASALSLGSAVAGFVAYDASLAAAARKSGLQVIQPA